MRQTVKFGVISLFMIGLMGLFVVWNSRVANYGYLRSLNEIYHDAAIHNLSRLTQEYKQSFEMRQLENHRHRFEMDKLYVPIHQAVSPIRVLCLVLTNPKSHKEKAQAVFDTWGQRCTFLYFLSTKNTDAGEFGLPVIHNTEKEDYSMLWSKVKFGFDFAYKHLLDQVDWVFKGDDDTYVIMENMHNMLAQHDPTDPLWFGSFYTNPDKYINPGYYSGGSGYVLSRKAVEMLGPKLNDSAYCKVEPTGAEDREMGHCMTTLGVKTVNTKRKNEETFFPLNIWQIMTMTEAQSDWYWRFKSFPEPRAKIGFECCSSEAVSFHYIPPNEI